MILTSIILVNSPCLQSKQTTSSLLSRRASQCLLSQRTTLVVIVEPWSYTLNLLKVSPIEPVDRRCSNALWKLNIIITMLSQKTYFTYHLDALTSNCPPLHKAWSFAHRHLLSVILYNGIVMEFYFHFSLFLCLFLHSLS